MLVLRQASATHAKGVGIKCGACAGSPRLCEVAAYWFCVLLLFFQTLRAENPLGDGFARATAIVEALCQPRFMEGAQKNY